MYWISSHVNINRKRKSVPKCLSYNEMNKWMINRCVALIIMITNTFQIMTNCMWDNSSVWKPVNNHICSLHNLMADVIIAFQTSFSLLFIMICLRGKHIQNYAVNTGRSRWIKWVVGHPLLPEWKRGGDAQNSMKLP